MKTSELTGVALDWAVANALEVQVWVGDGPALFLDKHYPFCNSTLGDFWVPSTDWAQGGPIIEREGICLIGPHEIDGEMWCAYQRFTMDRFHSPSPLIAAMRCYVASKLGDEVEVSKGLL